MHQEAFVGAAVALVLAVPSLAAAVPLSFTHQGRLLDASGTPMNATKSVTFHLYDAATGGTSLWSQTTSVTFQDGYYAVTLDALDPAVFDGNVRYLAVVVDGAELGPRTGLLTVPYAMRAGEAERVVGGVRVGNGTGSCGGTPEGTLDWTGTELRICDGTGWRTLQSRPTAADGSTQERAAVDCRTLHAAFPTLGSGTYWLDPDGDGHTFDAFQAWCDMTTDGGGWTVIANNDNSDAEPSGCIPRIASDSSLVCGTGGPSTADWSVPADEFTFTELVWAAYTGSYAVSAYNLMQWTTPQRFPATAGEWRLVADVRDVTIADWSGLPKIGCTTGGVNTLALVENNFPASGDYGTTQVVTMWSGGPAVDNLHMSFTEHSVWAAGQSMYGLDDFQDGTGCGDGWVPIDQRGRSSFVMIR